MRAVVQRDVAKTIWSFQGYISRSEMATVRLENEVP